jgi:hypothetical protein
MGSIAAHRSTAWSERLLVLAGVCALFALVWHHMAIVGDGFWYIATGRLILERGRMPQEDVFSFASAPGQWHAVSAVSETLFAYLADHVGLRGLMVFATIVEGLAAAGVWLTWAKTPLARLVTLPLALLFIQVDSQDLSARGQVFGDLGFVVLMWILFRLRAQARFHPFLAFALGALWVNLHLSFQMTMVVPVVFAATLFFEARADRPPIAPFFVFAFCAFLGFFVNPYGASYLRVIWKLTFSPDTARFDLFQSPDFHDPVWLIGPALGVALAVWRFQDPSPWRRSEAVLLVGFVFAACVSRRFVAQLLTLESAIIGHLAFSWRPARAMWVAALAAAVSAPLGVGAFVWGREKLNPLRDVPADAAAVIRDKRLPGNVMNPLHWGGYLAYAWKGEPRYFIDGRDHVMLYGNGAFADSVVLREGTAGWREILDIYGIGTVLWERGMPLDWLLAQDDRWQCVHRDRIAVVYTRR